MPRIFHLLTVIVLLAAAVFANTRLYLTDGEYHIVSEYEVLQDRVRFYSTERKQWEEMPLELVDLKRTNAEAVEREAAVKAELEVEAAEDEALRAQREQIARIPVNYGVYQIQGADLVPLAPGDIVIAESATRKILQVLAPGPIVAGKLTVTTEGASAAFRVPDNEPEFYFRMSLEERLDIIRLDQKKDERVIETADIMPDESGTFETMQTIPTFKQRLDRRLYRIWPQQPLEPGEYAVVQYTEGEMNIQVWPFGVGPAKE